MAGASQKPIPDILIKDIGQAALTQFSLDPPPDTLLQSIKELGITHPILLRTDGKKYQIVCGHRRVACARRLRFESVPAFVLDATPPPSESLKLNLLENLGQREYSDIEKGWVVHQLSEAQVPEADIIKEYLPLLDLERSKKLFADLNQCAVFSESLSALLHGLNLPLRVFATLFRWDEASRAAAETLLDILRPGVNKCRELLELTDETAVKEKTSPYEILSRPEIQTPLQDAGLPAGEKYDAIHKQLRLWRYPVLTDLQSRVYRAIDQLQLDGKTKLRVPENFESGQFKIELNFSSRDELIAQVEQLFGVTDSDALEELIRIFKEFK